MTRRFTALIPAGVAAVPIAHALALPPVVPAAGLAVTAAGVAAAAVTRGREQQTDRLEGFRTKLTLMLGEPTSLRQVRSDRDGPTHIAVTYPARFDDFNPTQRAKVAELVNARLPGRWELRWDTIGNRFEAWKRPPMPVRVDRPTRPDRDRFPLGVDESGRTVYWEPSVLPHALIVGATGAGKSVLISGLIMHAVASGWEVRIVDGKGTTLAGFRGWPGVTVAGFGDAEEMAPVLTATEREMRDRYRRVRAGQVEVESLQPLLLVIDEAAEMTGALTRWWTDNKPDRRAGKLPPGIDAWRSVARLGREARVHLVLGIQQAAASFFHGTEARDNFGLRVALGPTTQESADMAFGQSWAGRDVPLGAKGRATVNTDTDGGRFPEVQTFYSPELRPSGRAKHDEDQAAAQQWWAMARDRWPEIQSEPAPDLESAAGTASPVAVHLLTAGARVRVDGAVRVLARDPDPSTDDPDDVAEVTFTDGSTAELSWESTVEVLQ